MSKADFYQTLGVSRNATLSEIKTAYKKLAHKYHPDINKAPDAEERFKEVNEAYQTLSNSEKRNQYDQFGHMDEQGGGYHQETNPFDIFEQFFQQGSNSQRGFTEPKQEYQIISLTFLEAVRGCTYPLTYKSNHTCGICRGNKAFKGDQEYIKFCKVCDGSGVQVVQSRSFFGIINSKKRCSSCGGSGKKITKTCNSCRGSGSVSQTKSTELEMFAGVQHGEKLVLEDGSVVGGKIFLEVRISRSRIFDRQGGDIYTKILINPLIAILGGEAQVPSPWGIKTIEIPKNTKDKQHLQIKGLGIKALKGDLVGVIEYTDLHHLSSADQKILRSLELKESKESLDWIAKAKKEINLYD